MILGIGIDVVHVQRIEHWQDSPGLIERFFHPAEIASLANRGHKGAALALAARFAAKEAMGKALGIGLAGIRLVDIQVRNRDNGMPQILLEGTALRRFNELGAVRIHLSLTHESDNAIAMVVVEDDR